MKVNLPIYLCYVDKVEKLGVKQIKKINDEPNSSEQNGGYDLWECELPDEWTIQKHQTNPHIQNVLDKNSELVMQIDLFQEHMYIP